MLNKAVIAMAVVTLLLVAMSGKAHGDWPPIKGVDGDVEDWTCQYMSAWGYRWKPDGELIVEPPAEPMSRGEAIIFIVYKRGEEFFDRVERRAKAIADDGDWNFAIICASHQQARGL